jgi:cytochrome c oxidase subunit 3
LATNLPTGPGVAGPAVAGHGEGGHHPYQQHHFFSMAQQLEASILGMWVFLVTEVMFFGGLFMAYIVYRSWYPDAWAHSSNQLNVYMGALNTVVLICSSLTMVLAVRSAQVGSRKGQILNLILTIVFGTTFLVVKYFEYAEKFHHGLVPGANFNPHHVMPDGTIELIGLPPQSQLFFSLYFMLTGIHALHMVVGIGIMLVMLRLAWKGRFTPDYYNPIEISGLYWHFVDIVWIFLFPLLYLLGFNYKG